MSAVARMARMGVIVLLFCASAAHTCVGQSLVSATHTCAGYHSPGTNVIYGQVAYSSTWLSLKWTPSLPTGWALGTASGDSTPEANTNEGDIVFTGSLTNNPISFSYTVIVPPGVAGTTNLGGTVEYQLDGMDNPSTTQAAPHPLVMTQLQYLVVFSDHDGAVPPVGTNIYANGALVEGAVTNSPVADGDGQKTQYVCVGWTLAGCTDTNGLSGDAGTNMVLALTNDAALTWSWKTQYQLTATAGAHGSVDQPDQWVDADSNVTITATASNYYHFSGWSGDTNGCAMVGNVITAAMTQARAITAAFAVTLTARGTPWPWLALFGLGPDDDERDNDFDGMKTWEEYVAGTDPTNPASLLAIAYIVRQNGSNILGWASSTNGPNLPYGIERRTDMRAGDWTTVDLTVPRTLPSNTWQEAVGAAGRYFYRVVATNLVGL